MRVRVIERLGGRVIDVEAVVVVIEDDQGNPLQTACEVSRGIVSLARVSDPYFDATLASLGIDKMVIADHLSTPPPQGELLFRPGGFSRATVRPDRRASRPYR